MTFAQYKKFVESTIKYPKGWIYPALALAEEAGEVAGKFAKLLRHGGADDYVFRSKVAKELGDVLWNLTALAHEISFDLETIAIRNVEKLKERQAKGTIHGSGDDR